MAKENSLSSSLSKLPMERNGSWDGKLQQAKDSYSYQQDLTAKLDSHEGDFNEQTILEIVLWKTNRYPWVSPDVLRLVNDLRRNYEQEGAENALRGLLGSQGFDLPMASTVLRFACPKRFQIIDQRVYRLITPGEDKLRIPTNVEDKVILYFRYLNRLRDICAIYDIAFIEADRILYQLDKIENKGVAIH